MAPPSVRSPEQASVDHGLTPDSFDDETKLWRAGRPIRGDVRFAAEPPELVLIMHNEGKRPDPRRPSRMP